MENRWTVVLVVVGALLLLLVLKRFASDPLVDGAEAKRLVEQGATLVDVRTTEEFQSGHLPGAVNIPVHEIDARAGEIPGEKPVVLYCRSGARSGQAASVLRGKGRTDIFNLGGMSRW